MGRNTASKLVASAALACLAAAGACPKAEAADYKILHSFAGGAGNDGEYPYASLIEVGGVLYGTTLYGRSSLAGCHPGNPTYVDGCGTVFSVTPAGQETILHAFLDTPDGNIPQASLLFLSGRLLGTTLFGGHPDGPNKGTGSGKGTVFALAPDGTETVDYRFNGVPDGKRPFSGLIDVGGTLYGTTEYGGAAGYGTVFALAPDGKETVLHSFAGGGDGRVPIGNLINVNGVLYGTTQFGGSGCNNGCGTVFSITPAGVETVLFRLQADTGAYPTGALLQVGNELYGMAFSGAAEGVGSVFSITLNGQPTGVHPFRRDNGGYPAGSLIDVGGTLYGTTSSFGASTACVFGCGTIFSMSPNGPIKDVHDFEGGSADGSQPEAGLIDVGGVLYGTTESGGGTGCQFGEGCGTVFAFTP